MAIDLTSQIEPALVPAYLALEYEASAPYYEFVFDDEAEARRAQRVLWEAGAGEWVPPHGHAIMLDGEFAGLIGGVRASDLRLVRLRASLALSRAGIPRDEDQANRMRMAAQTLVKPEPGDFYYGQVAVTKPARKSGMIEELFEIIRRYASACGARRCVFQAHADSPRLIAFYERTGQERERIGEAQATDPKTGRKLHYIHFATDLACWQRWRENHLPQAGAVAF